MSSSSNNQPTTKRPRKSTPDGGVSCSVCQQVGNKYKCPKCRAIYCSMACNTVHKTCCQPTTSSPAGTSTEEQPLDNKTRRSTFTTNNTTTTHVKLSNEALQLLSKSTSLQKALQSKRLREDILKVETASNRQVALKKLRIQNPEFEEFVQSLVRVVKPLVAQQDKTTNSLSSATVPPS